MSRHGTQIQSSHLSGSNTSACAACAATNMSILPRTPTIVASQYHPPSDQNRAQHASQVRNTGATPDSIVQEDFEVVHTVVRCLAMGGARLMTCYIIKEAAKYTICTQLWRS